MISWASLRVPFGFPQEYRKEVIGLAKVLWRAIAVAPPDAPHVVTALMGEQGGQTLTADK